MTVNALRCPRETQAIEAAYGPRPGEPSNVVNRIKAIFSNYQGQIALSPAFACSSRDGHSYILLDKDNRLAGVQTPQDTFWVTACDFSAQDEHRAIGQVLAELAHSSIDKAKLIPSVWLPIHGAVEVRRIQID